MPDEHGYRRESDVLLGQFRHDLALQAASIDTLREAVDMNRESVVRLARDFHDHVEVERADRLRREELDKMLAGSISELRLTIVAHSATFSDYQEKMRPVEESVDWVRISKKILIWVASVAGATFALVEAFGRLGGL